MELGFLILGVIWWIACDLGRSYIHSGQNREILLIIGPFVPLMISLYMIYKTVV